MDSDIEHTAESKEPKTESRVPRAESREPKAESRLSPSRFQQQVLEVKAEVRVRRDRPHLRLIDRAVRVERKCDVGVGPQLAVLPAGDEGVVLPRFELAAQRRRAGEA